MTNMRARLARLEERRIAAPELIAWHLDDAQRASACGLTQADDETRAQFLVRVAAGRSGIIWVDDLDARL